MDINSCHFKPAYQVYCQQEDNFITLLKSIVYEKENTCEDALRIKSETAFKRALPMFSIEGDEDFKHISIDRLKKICSLKPGRVLMKALSRTNFVIHGNKIKLTHGNKWAFETPRQNISCIKSDPHPYYNGLRMDGAQWSDTSRIYEKPDFITLAHELIHFLHFQLKFPDRSDEYQNHRAWFSHTCEEVFDCIGNMDDLEEQHTESGFSHLVFKNLTNLSKTDVLCENAFLFALGIPPRIDHRGYNEKTLQSKIIVKPLKKIVDKKIIHIYSEWMKMQLAKIYEIPSCLENDSEFIINRVMNSLDNLQQVPHFKNSELFITRLLIDLKNRNQNLNIMEFTNPNLVNENYIKRLLKFIDPVLVIKALINLHEVEDEPLSKTIMSIRTKTSFEMLFKEEVTVKLIDSTLINRLYISMIEKISNAEFKLTDLSSFEKHELIVIKSFIKQVEVRLINVNTESLIRKKISQIQKLFKLDIID